MEPEIVYTPPPRTDPLPRADHVCLEGTHAVRYPHGTVVRCSWCGKLWRQVTTTLTYEDRGEFSGLVSYSVWRQVRWYNLVSRYRARRSR